MITLLREFRLAFRTLRKSPTFTLVAVATLALAIGANTAIFSAVDAVVLRPLDYVEPGRIVRIQTSWEGTPDAAISPAEYFDYRDELDGVSALGVYTIEGLAMTGTGEPEQLRGAYVSSGVLPALGAAAWQGRVFTAEEELPDHDVAVLSHGLWQRRFGGSADVIGRRIVLNGRPHTVLGVLPAGFRLPEDYTAGEVTEVYVPLGIDRATVPNRGSHFLVGVARLAPGVTVERAAAAVTALAARMVERHPDAYPAKMRFTATALPLADDVVGAVRPALLVLLAAVGLVLLVACANVANLLLARAEARQREFAVRAALGAGRGRLIRQILIESLLLATCGGAFGVLLAVWGTDLLVALRPPDLPRIGEVSVDARVIGFAAAVIVLTGALFGVAPALQATGRRLTGVLREGGGRTTGGRQRLRESLVVGEIALAIVLLVGAGLLTRSFIALRSVDPGYRVEHVLTARLTLPEADYAEDAEVRDFYRRLTERVGALPGVTAAGAVTNLPLATRLGDLNFRIEGRDVPEGDVAPRADWQTVTPGYFAAMGMQLLRGRGIEATDIADAPGVVVINETLARRYWPGEDAIGQRFLLGGGAGPGWVTVVGIVRDVRHAALGETPNGQMYLSHAQFHFWNGGGPVRAMTLAMRTVADPATVADAVRRELRALDPLLPIGEFRTMQQVASASVARPRLMMALLLTFAGVALVLGGVGIYGVVAYGVARRTREIGIRLALGARPAQVVGLILRQSLARTTAGVAIGIAAAATLTRVLSGMLYGVAPLDAATFAAVPLFLGMVAVFASWVPARRGSRLEPTAALREE